MSSFEQTIPDSLFTGRDFDTQLTLLKIAEHIIV
jgi:hypothetical protein